MGHKIGDAVRLRDGSELRGLLEPFEDATGFVFTTSRDGQEIAVSYPAPIDLHTSFVPSAEFVPDRPLSTAPF